MSQSTAPVAPSALEGVLEDFDLLAGQGVYGFYDFCEVTSVFLLSEKSIYNYFTIVAFDEYGDSQERDHILYLTPSLCRIDKQFKLGICRFYSSVSEARVALATIVNEGRWVNAGSELRSWSQLRPLRKQFVPPNSILSSMLKQNDKNGSYILELFDAKKEICQQLSDTGRDRIAKEVMEYLPIHLDSFKDRAGNILFQFPSKLFAYHLRSSKEWDGVTVQFAWHPRHALAKTRYRVETTSIVDDVIMGFAVSEVISGDEQPLILRSGNSEFETAIVVSNPARNLVHCSYAGTFVRQFNFSGNLGMQNAEPRTIREGNGRSVEIPLTTKSPVSTKSGAPTGNSPYYSQIYDRQQDAKILELSVRGEFRQFQPGRSNSRVAALDHVRDIIIRYADNQICIWDPYIQYREILDTAYHCGRLPTSIRVIASYRESGRSRKALVSNGLFCRPKDSGYTRFRYRQANGFQTCSNNLGIDLEMRCRHENFGWRFHDRFLILPQSTFRSDVRVWSLGTSLNSLGKAGHHIIQEVPNPKPIYSAFLDLWGALQDESCVVWRHPT